MQRKPKTPNESNVSWTSLVARHNARKGWGSNWSWEWLQYFGLCQKFPKTVSFGQSSNRDPVIQQKPMIQKRMKGGNVRSHGQLKAWFFVTVCLIVNCCKNMPSTNRPAYERCSGWPVCRISFLKLLGISASRLVRTRHTFKGVDARTLGSTLVKQSMSIQFLQLPNLELRT